jgi:hypothetical protein
MVVGTLTRWNNERPLSKKHADYNSAENPTDSDQCDDSDRREYQPTYPVAIHSNNPSLRAYHPRIMRQGCSRERRDFESNTEQGQNRWCT